MGRAADPGGDIGLERGGCDIGMAGHHNLDQRRHAARHQRAQIARRPSAQRIRREDRRISLRLLAQSVERIKKLEIDRLFSPERSVIIEDGDPLILWHEVGRCRIGHCRDKVQDCSLGRRLLPRRKRVCLQWQSKGNQAK
jgi:hypothetical protein